MISGLDEISSSYIQTRALGGRWVKDQDLV